MRLETEDSGQSAAAPSWRKFVLLKIFRIQEKWNSTSLFIMILFLSCWKLLHLGCRMMTILLDTFYIYLCVHYYCYCKITLVLVSEDEYLLDIYTIYYLVFTVTRAAVDTRSHFTRLWSGLSMKYESYCHLSQHWQHCSWLNLLLQTRFSFIFSPWTWKCGKVVPLVW